MGGRYGEGRAKTWRGYRISAFGPVGGMAGWHRVGPLRGLLLIPVTLRAESRRCATEILSYGRVHATEVLGTRTVPFARTRSRS